MVKNAFYTEGVSKVVGKFISRLKWNATNKFLDYGINIVNSPSELHLKIKPTYHVATQRS